MIMMLIALAEQNIASQSIAEYRINFGNKDETGNDDDVDGNIVLAEDDRE